MKPIDRAIQAAGGRTELAEKLGVTRQATYHWDEIPSKFLIAIERLTGIPRQELRPDLYRGMK